MTHTKRLHKKMGHLETHKSALDFYTRLALHQAMDKHLMITGKLDFSLLDNPSAEIDNRTCKQAFCDTFSSSLRAASQNMIDSVHAKHDVDITEFHHSTVDAVCRQVSNLVEQRGGSLSPMSIYDEVEKKLRFIHEP